MNNSRLKKIKFLNILLEENWPKDEYILINSALLSFLGLRQNSDLDLIISSSLREKYFKNYDPNIPVGLNGKFEKRIRIHPQNSLYGSLYNCNDIDMLINKFSVKIDNVKFVEPKFIFMYKLLRYKKLIKRKNNLHIFKKSLGLLLSENRILNRKINRDKYDLIFFESLLKSSAKHLFSEFSNSQLDFPKMRWRL